MPENMEEKFTRQDRDTIIRLDTKFDRLSQDIKELKDSVVDRVSKLESDSANKADLALVKQKADDLLLRKANHEDIVCLDVRVSVLEKYRSWLVGVGVGFGVIIGLVVYIYFSNLNEIKLDLEKHISQTIK